MTKKYPNSIGRMDERISMIYELQEIQQEIIRVFCREVCTLYEAKLVTIWLSEHIDKLAQSQDPYESRFSQNKAETGTSGAIEDDMLANSIQNIVNEILQEIGDIFIRERLFAPECEMIMKALEEKIKNASQRKGE